MTIGITSGTSNFNLPYSDIFLEAFERCQIEPAALDRRHIISAKRSINLELLTWSNRGVNLWAVDLQTISLANGVATYIVDPATVTVLDVYFSTPNASGPGIDNDRFMMPIGRTQYDMIPSKLQPGTPTVYWYQKLEDGLQQMSIWQPPLVGAPTNVVKFHRLRRVQDAAPTMGQVADVPSLFLDALCAGLAARVAQKFAPALYVGLKEAAKEAWNEASTANREDVPISIRPVLHGYFPR
jgi:hypothetical protein